MTLHPAIQRALDEADIPYVVHRHSAFAQPIRSPQDFAGALGYDTRRITKSLFVRRGGAYAVIVCSSDDNVDFKQAARLLGCKRVEVAGVDELEDKLGYPPSGVAPLGIDAAFPIVMDESLTGYDTILVGAGSAGVEVEIEPRALADLVGASVARVVKAPRA
jgi:Cys-tRNA(Pro)/Cys-tRNA(Cys) deacylase